MGAMANQRETWNGQVRRLPAGIAVGRRFVATEYRGVIWEIVAVSRYIDEPIPHARLARVGAPYDMKTVSVQVLSDRRYFQELEAP